MHDLPSNYSERVYAGVLGKIIGVYLGRPFEGWRYQRIVDKLGQIEAYQHEKLGMPLVVTDDDISGTFTFLRALEDYGVSEDLTAEDIGKGWLNYIVEKRTILWWGGRGNSTEHTAWLNLADGIPAPRSGSIAVNGKTVAEQIGAQIFIDGWGLVAPGRPELAAKLARAAGSVSHDGASVDAGVLWAAMEAEAFVNSDINHLIDTGLRQIPRDSDIAKLIADIREWCAKDNSWEATRERIEAQYGYDKYHGVCHVVPNHALMIMAILHARDDFSRALTIVNTSGWDTDCNSGNVGCLMGIMHGLAAFDGGYDWRTPIADRMLISSADGGNSINDAVRVADWIEGLGRRLAGGKAQPKPKNDALFHFSQPGSLQGFRVTGDDRGAARVENVGLDGSRALAISYPGLAPGQALTALTPVFAPPEVVRMQTYDLMASPLVSPGQTVTAHVVADGGNTGPVSIALRLNHYTGDDGFKAIDGPDLALQPGRDTVLCWRIPDVGAQPIAEIGIVVRGASKAGRVVLDWLTWNGAPDVELRAPTDGGTFWRRAWVDGVSSVWRYSPPSFRISKDRGEGLLSYGTRQWTDYRVEAPITPLIGGYVGLAGRLQGLRRYYAVRVTREGRAELVRRRDEDVTILASAPHPLVLDEPVAMSLTFRGSSITATAGTLTLTADDTSAAALADGGVGLLIADGALIAESVKISPI